MASTQPVPRDPVGGMELPSKAEDIVKFINEHKDELLEELDIAQDILGSDAATVVENLINNPGTRLPPSKVVSSPQDKGKSDMKSGRTGGKHKAVDFKAFANKAVDYAIEQSDEAKGNELWDSFWLKITEKESRFYLDGDDLEPQALKKELGNLDLDSSIVTKCAIGFGSKCKVFSPPFTSIALDIFFGKVVYVGDKLEEYLDDKLVPLENTTIDSDVMPPDLSYVSCYPQDPDKFFETLNQQEQEKEYAIVVAGESGSGKSVFACLQAKKHQFLPIYCLLNGKDLRDKPVGSQFQKLNTLLRLYIITYDKDTTLVNGLYDIKHRLNQDRNNWAETVLERAIKGVVGSKWEIWYDGRLNEASMPEKVAIIVDEATDIDLAEGLIATVKSSMNKYSKLAKSRVQLVIAGTGLDNIRHPDRVGTNPEYSRLVIMKSPNLTNIPVSPEVEHALNHGSYSSVFKTNARMLFRLVLPILSSKYHKVDDNKLEPEKKRQRLENRLVKVGSSRCLMDHAPRFYIEQNAVGTMDETTRNTLLLQAFLFHLETSMKEVSVTGVVGKSMDSIQKNTERELERLRDLKVRKKLTDEDPYGIIFSRGLAIRGHTSAALKYLSCFGLSCEVRLSFEDEFEEMVALHYMRLKQADGFDVTRRVVLKHAWPPKNSRKTHDFDELREKLAEQKKTELRDASVFQVPDDGKLCLVFSQGTASAQGGDVLALVVDEQDAYLESIQSKHWRDIKSKETWLDWWCSLGVQLNENGSAILDPKSGSAGYSYMGLDAFRQLLQEKLKRKVRLKTRTLAVSFKTPTDGKNFPIPDHDDARVWFREMFEPTISVIPPNVNKAVEEEEAENN